MLNADTHTCVPLSNRKSRWVSYRQGS